ncbi:MAG TPA: hypothetical protein VMR46_02520 [Candidatus Paceibacterota bacterium]|nr:hypothetical protein [Candidatus Paceibacterota bacterium]
MSKKPIIYILSGLLVVLVLVFGVWFLFFRTTSTPVTSTATLFGASANNTTTATPNTSAGTTANGTLPAAQSTTQKIFEINAGPVAGATLIQTLHPTTTLARYVNQEDGHVYDMPLDVSGAVPRVVSDVTIPGIEGVVWLEAGNAAILQYIDTDGVTVKSVYLGLPAATTSTQLAATRIQFLPDNIISLAASPDGKSVAYLLKTPSGSSGYSANSDGTGAKKLFSLPLAQVLIQWPSSKTILVTTKSDFNSQGMLFVINASTGSIAPALYAQGLTAVADPSFANIIYQAVSQSTNSSATYIHNIKAGGDLPLPFNPFPEQCIFSTATSTSMYCAAPLSYEAPGFLDLWHQGTASAVDAIYSFNIQDDSASLTAAPGSGNQGGVASDILEMALSPDEHYLSFTTKGTRELWGVRLSN